jgi:2-phosphosulfolactate phosphatase
MTIDVVPLPRELTPAHLEDHCVVVFDVLRATTTMTAALAAGVKEIFVLPDIDAVTVAATMFGPDAVTCGERDCLAPPGFTLGNSPGGFKRTLAGRTAFMSTTNGTKAIIATKGAAQVFVGSVVNASAVARTIRETGLGVTLLCAGTGGQVAMEDLIGAGAVIDRAVANGPVVYGSDVALLAHHLFRSSNDDLVGTFSRTRGGQNVIRNGLEDDIDFCGRLDAFVDVVGRVDHDPLCVRRI